MRRRRARSSWLHATSSRASRAPPGTGGGQGSRGGAGDAGRSRSSGGRHREGGQDQGGVSAVLELPSLQLRHEHVVRMGHDKAHPRCLGILEHSRTRAPVLRRREGLRTPDFYVGALRRPGSRGRRQARPRRDRGKGVRGENDASREPALETRRERLRGLVAVEPRDKRMRTGEHRTPRGDRGIRGREGIEPLGSPAAQFRTPPVAPHPEGTSTIDLVGRAHLHSVRPAPPGSKRPPPSLAEPCHPRVQVVGVGEPQSLAEHPQRLHQHRWRIEVRVHAVRVARVAR